MSSLALVGPSSGNLGVTSLNFTVTPSAVFTGVVTPASTLSGTFSPTSLTFTSSTTAQTFTFTPSVGGTATISITNTGGFTNPSALTYIVVSPPVSYITTAGGADIAAASPSGPYINITSFKIGSDNIYADSAATLKALTSVQSGGANAAVYTMTSSAQLQYSVLTPNQVMYLVTLDETVGNFTIGNIGLYTSDGTLFDIVALSQTTNKIANSSTTLGNRRVYECLVNFTNAATLSSLTTLTEYAYNLATVATQAALPSPSSPPYNIYLVQNYTTLGIPCLAINYNSLWNFVPTQYAGPVTVGNYFGALLLSANTTLTVDQLGYFIELNGSSTYTTTIPAPSNAGGHFYAWNNSGIIQNIVTPSGAFYGPGGSTTATLSVGNNVAVDLIADGNNWLVFTRNSQLPFYTQTVSPGITTSVTATFQLATQTVTFPTPSATGGFRLKVNASCNGVSVGGGMNQQFNLTLSDGTTTLQGTTWIISVATTAEGCGLESYFMMPTTYLPGTTLTLTLRLNTGGYGGGLTGNFATSTVRMDVQVENA